MYCVEADQQFLDNPIYLPDTASVLMILLSRTSLNMPQIFYSLLRLLNIRFIRPIYTDTLYFLDRHSSVSSQSGTHMSLSRICSQSSLNSERTALKLEVKLSNCFSIEEEQLEKEQTDVFNSPVDTFDEPPQI